jgi:hypothetical protein
LAVFASADNLCYQDLLGVGRFDFACELPIDNARQLDIIKDIDAQQTDTRSPKMTLTTSLTNHSIRLNQTETNLVTRIAESFSRAKDEAEPQSLPWEIQYQLNCSWGRALTIANAIRLTLN